VNYITNVKGMYCVLDMQNYHRYRGQLLGTSAVPIYTIHNVWYRLAGQFLNNPRVLYAVMNQPYDVPAKDVLQGVQFAINGIRNVGATVRPFLHTQLRILCALTHARLVCMLQQPILVDGSDYSAVSTWVGTNSQWMGPSNLTGGGEIYYEMHQFFGDKGAQTVCNPSTNIASLFGSTTAWARSVGAYVSPPPVYRHLVSVVS
jgi:endoglucanase